MIDVRKLDLRKLNSLTKYPSILTYHKLDPKNGRLLPEVQIPFAGSIIATEKVDGCNARIILYKDNFILGSREELLYGRGDLIENPTESIVPALKEAATESIVPALKEAAETFLNPQDDRVIVIYAEVFGGNIGGSGKAFKQYTSKNQLGFCVFDIVVIPGEDVLQYMTWPLGKFRNWRESGGQNFVSENALADWAKKLGFSLTPRLDIGILPTDINEMLPWLEKNIPQTLCSLDDGAGKKAEGIVVRTIDRSKIAKIRFEDYRRTKIFK